MNWYVESTLQTRLDHFDNEEAKEEKSEEDPQVA